MEGPCCCWAHHPQNPQHEVTSSPHYMLSTWGFSPAPTTACWNKHVFAHWSSALLNLIGCKMYVRTVWWHWRHGLCIASPHTEESPESESKRLLGSRICISAAEPGSFLHAPLAPQLPWLQNQLKCSYQIAFRQACVMNIGLQQPRDRHERIVCLLRLARWKHSEYSPFNREVVLQRGNAAAVNPRME